VHNLVGTLCTSTSNATDTPGIGCISAVFEALPMARDVKLAGSARRVEPLRYINNNHRQRKGRCCNCSDDAVKQKKD
jgi:hypothetical protein